MTTKFKFETQYSQFYIADKKAPKENLSFHIDWNDDDFEARLAPLNTDLVIFTSCYGYVKGDISILNNMNTDFDLSKYDHIVEQSIDIESGIIQLLDCPTRSIEFEKKIKPGKYRVRVYFSNLDSVIDPDIEALDYYKIEMWLDDNTQRKVLKQY